MSSPEEQSLVGAHILVGLTYLNADDSVHELVQLHGTITDVSPGEGTLSFERSDGAGSFSIPFDDTLRRSDPANVYTLVTTGEKVTKVDFVATFERRAGDDG